MVGTKIFTRLAQLNKTNEWLANEMGVSPQYIGALKHRKSFTTTTLKKLSIAMDIPLIYWLYPDTEPETVVQNILQDCTLILQTKQTK